MPVSSSMAHIQAFGPAFVGDTILNVTDASTPLLTQDGSADVLLTYDTSLQPDELTEAQEETYNELCRTVLDALEGPGLSRVIKLSQDFQHSTRGENWAQSWAGRFGIPLAYFRDSKGWKALSAYLSQPP